VTRPSGARLITAVVLAGLVAACAPEPARLAPSRPPAVVEEILGWLPADTQTVTVLNGPMDVPLLRQVEPAQEEEPAHVIDWMLGFALLGPLGQEHRRHLLGLPVAVAVEGSRRFRKPRALGMMPYEGCHIVLFQNELGPAGDALLASLASEGARERTLAGHRVMEREEQWEDDQWRILVAHPRPSVLLIGTHEGYLRDVLERMDRPGSSRALPPHLPEWGYLDPGARLWAVRHHDAADAPNDPSSPLNERQMMARDATDPGAVGLVFGYHPDRRLLKVTYLTRASDPTRLPRALWQRASEGLTARIRRIAAGVATVELADDDRGVATLLFVTQMALGHGLFL
jgi:hypothetical protein